MSHVNTMCEKDAEFTTVKIWGTQSNYLAREGKIPAGELNHPNQAFLTLP